MSRKHRKQQVPLHGADRKWAESVFRGTDAIICDMPLPEGKVSDIVADFAEPLVETFAESDEDQVDILTFACILWNLAIVKRLSKTQFYKMETETVHALANAPFYLSPDGALNLLTDMLKRWDTEFSWCRRMIVNKRIAIKADKIQMSIASTPIPDLDKLDSAAENPSQEANA
jgi:hypothetical protein